MAKSIKLSKTKKETIIFQSSKAKQETSFFPKINRFITETWKFFVVSFASGLLIIAIVLQSISLLNNIQEEKRLRSTHDKTVAELKYWEQIVSQYKDYRDGYFKLASIEYRLGNVEASRVYLKKTLDLDPNFQKGRELEKILGS